ncbi:MOSC domain-containing protein [Mycena kentingensis (nom. inval.)]|nr:MOSC domain-containing protein [Mycena kentingensis (nom. inval.)]
MLGRDLDALYDSPLRSFLILGLGIASLYVVSGKGWRNVQLLTSSSSAKRDTVHGTDLRISRIMIYPIKSCAAIDLQSSGYDKEGLEFDRKWMVVDLEKNKQLSARDNRGIKLIRVIPALKRDPASPTGGVLEVSFPDSPETPTFSVPLNPTPEQLASWDVHQGFDIWGHADEGYVVESSDPMELFTPSEILSEYVGRPVLLVMKHPSLAPRPTGEMEYDSASLGYAGGSTVRYPDATPFLLVSDASLINAEEKVRAMARGEYARKVAGCKPDEPAPPVGEWALPGGDAKKLLMERFRPNIVVSGVTEAFGEDDWQEIVSPDGKRFLLPMRCPRCMFPNVDTESGKRDPQMPNNAMMQYRRVDKAAKSKYCFGMYMIPREADGVLNVGDAIIVSKSELNPKLTDGEETV